MYSAQVLQECQAGHIRLLQQSSEFRVAWLHNKPSSINGFSDQDQVNIPISAFSNPGNPGYERPLSCHNAVQSSAMRRLLDKSFSQLLYQLDGRDQSSE